MAQQEVLATGKAIGPENLIFQTLSNGTTDDAIGDYSSTVEKFTFAPAAGRIAELERMIVHIEDVGALPSDKYGYDVVLTNGIRIYVRDGDDEIITTMDAGIPVKTNGSWSAMCYDVNNLTWGAGSDTIAVRWTFAKAGYPLRLDARKGHYLSVELNDDFTGLVMHHFLVQGIYTK